MQPTNTIAAESDAFIAREKAKHFGDRYSHRVILADCSIAMEHPESEDDNGEPVPSKRRIEEPGCSIDLGREYHVPPGVNAFEWRNALIDAAIR